MEGTLSEDRSDRRRGGRPPAAPPYRSKTVRAAFQVTQEVKAALRRHGVAESDVWKLTPVFYLDFTSKATADKQADALQEAARWLYRRGHAGNPQGLVVSVRPEVVATVRVGDRVREVADLSPDEHARVRGGTGYSVKFRADTPRKQGFGVTGTETGHVGQRAARARTRAASAAGGG